MFVLGDFNIPKIDDELWKAITKHGLQTHENILCDDHGSGFKEGKRYDQIFYYSENEHKIEDGGILNLYPKGRREPFKDIPKSKFEYKISDHFPLWIQVNVE